MYFFLFKRIIFIVGDGHIKKIFILLFTFLITFNVKATTTITTFAEYQEEIKKFDLLLLIVIPLIIVGIGTYLYFKKSKSKK